MTERVVITGGAGFLGSHLAEHHENAGDEVVVVDNFSTGRSENLAKFRGKILSEDVSEKSWLTALEIRGFAPDLVYHLASPASPVAYNESPLETLRVNSEGTRNALELAISTRARFVLASTSEVYGDPEEHPQPETYRGRVSPHGPRSQYDEGKRFSEALLAAYVRSRGLDARIARIFNTFGPRMDPNDGRVVINFVRQALAGNPLTIYGTGEQTRSLCSVSDTVHGLAALGAVGVSQRLAGAGYESFGPVNIGNPSELSVSEIARLVSDTLGVPHRVEHLEAAPDDPQRRLPDIRRAREVLGWSPVTPVISTIRELAEELRNVYTVSG